MRILIIEDEPMVLENLTDLLQSERVIINGATSVQDAMELLSHQSFDLIITDYWMPKKTGLDLIRFCKDQGIRVPIICLTGYDSPELRKQAWNYGIFDYVEKSSNTFEIMESVDSFVSLKNEIEKMMSLNSDIGLFDLPFDVIATKIHKTTFRGFLEWSNSQNLSPSTMAMMIRTQMEKPDQNSSET
jgi:YesN/AraC family two-component response regulator